MHKIPAFRHLSLPKMFGFLSVWRFLLSFVCLWTPAAFKMCDFSLLIRSYMSAITMWTILYFYFSRCEQTQCRYHFPIDASVFFYIRNHIWIFTLHVLCEIKQPSLHIHSISYHRSSRTHNNYTKQILNYTIFHFNSIVGSLQIHSKSCLNPPIEIPNTEIIHLSKIDTTVIYQVDSRETNLTKYI